MGQVSGTGQWDGGLLGPEQSKLAESWLEAPQLVADLSWGLVDTKVLHVHSPAGPVIVKAGAPANHHLAREIAAHKAFTRPLVEQGRAARVLHAEPRANVLVMEYLDGLLVEGTPAEQAPDTYVQAGRLLKLLHGQETRTDGSYEARATSAALAWLERDHRIDSDIDQEARRRLAGYRPQATAVVPTHGDWQPRNWLVHRGEIRIIDFGRFAFRPAATDLCRLAVQQWRGQPELEQAFLAGYGADPRSEAAWRIALLREAIGTAVWAFQVGDEAFENQGHRMLREALASW